MRDGESKAQGGQALGPTAHSKVLCGLAPASSHSLPPPHPPTSLIFLLMPGWATLDPTPGPLHLLFFLHRMLCPQIFPWLVPPCQAGLSSHVPSERPSLTSVTEVAHTSPLFISARQCFSCSSYYCKQLPYLFIYLFNSYDPLTCLVLCCTPST